ncbi:Uncharacterized membrane protein [Natronoarchaeum philippinense]|uniref:Uncharacterized membrane protein n=1 Tax=Natronoarchaeum philippinense TaxID=558529 RepID=A0A285NRS7_NATPI|nr:Uncharacterized membrane protein [Natronoarchaeum philippinense]
MATWKRDFGSGLVVLVPIIVTLWVLVWLFNFIAGAPLVNQINQELLVDLGFEGISTSAVSAVRVLVTLVVFVTLVFAVGYLMRTALGNVLEDRIDDLINRLPGLRVVYNASKMAAETALGGTEALQTPVKVEVWDGVRMTAFKTGKRTDDGRELLFMPTAPNITTGFVIEVEPEDIQEIDERVEDSLTRLLSAGFGDANNQSGGLHGVPIDVHESDTGRLAGSDADRSNADGRADAGADE